MLIGRAHREQPHQALDIQRVESVRPARRNQDRLEVRQIARHFHPDHHVRAGPAVGFVDQFRLPGLRHLSDLVALGFLRPLVELLFRGALDLISLAFLQRHSFGGRSLVDDFRQFSLGRGLRGERDVEQLGLFLEVVLFHPRGHIGVQVGIPRPARASP